MTTTISGTSGVTFPAGGVGNPAGTVVGTTDTQTLTNKTLTSPAISGAVMTAMASSVVTAGTAVPYSSATNAGTTIDFTSIPSWVKRITVLFQGVSMSSTNDVLVQIGTGGTPTITGYVSSSGRASGASASGTNSTAGFNVYFNAAASTLDGAMVLCKFSGNSWTASHAMGYTSGGVMGGGSLTLGGVLNIVRIKSASTDTFDAGSINILYE